jgi:predicted membrane metal-binding protein
MNMNIMSRTSGLAAPEDLNNERVPDDEAAPRRSGLRSWLLEDSPYIAMLLLALVGVVLRLPVTYWIILTPVFGIICVVAGWRQFHTRQDRIQLVTTQALAWLALIVAIYVLYNDGVQGVLSENATSLSMITLLALGTFMAGLLARTWRICAVGAILIVTVPAVGWLDQSAVLLMVATVAVIAIGGLTWWVDQRRHRAV